MSVPLYRLVLGSYETRFGSVHATAGGLDVGTGVVNLAVRERERERAKGRRIAHHNFLYALTLFRSKPIKWRVEVVTTQAQLLVGILSSKASYHACSGRGDGNIATCMEIIRGNTMKYMNLSIHDCDGRRLVVSPRLATHRLREHELTQDLAQG